MAKTTIDSILKMMRK